MSKSANGNKSKKKNVVKKGELSNGQQKNGGTNVSRKVAAKAMVRGALDQLVGVGQSGAGVMKSLNALTSANPSGLMDGIKDFVQGAKKVGQGISASVRNAKVVFNHPEWYTNYDLSGLVNLNFGYRKSLQNDVCKMLDMQGGNVNGRETTAIGRIVVDLCISKDSLNSFTQAISILYAKIRAANSGSVNFTQNDLACYILNVRSLRAALAMIVRALGISNYVSIYDSDLPTVLTGVALGAYVNKATPTGTNRGITFETVIANKANLINYVNTWIRTLKVLYPINLPLMDRTDWMFSNVFKDSDDVKANYWIFGLRAIPYYTASEDGTITRTERDLFNAKVSSEAAYTTLLSVINNFFTDMADNKVNAIIAGDILKTYGDSMLYNQMGYDVNYVCEPIYDEAALTQIQNANILDYQGGTLAESLNFNTNEHTITASRNPVEIADITSLNPKNTFINSYKDTVSPGELLSYTRLAPIVLSETDNVMKVTTCGFELIVEVQMISGFNKTIVPGYTYPEGSVTSMLSTSNTTESNNIKASILNAWTILDWAPMLRMTVGSGDSVGYSILWDFNNYAVATTADLDNFNQIATLSLLYTPEYIKRQGEFNFIK